MGSGLSSRKKTYEKPKKISIYKEEPGLLQYKPTFDALHITPKEVRKLKAVFDEIDVNLSGTIDLDEFCVFFHLEKSEFMKRFGSYLFLN